MVISVSLKNIPGQARDRMIMEKPLSSYKKLAPWNGSGPNWKIETPSPLLKVVLAAFCCSFLFGGLLDPWGAALCLVPHLLLSSFPAWVPAPWHVISQTILGLSTPALFFLPWDPWIWPLARLTHGSFMPAPSTLYSLLRIWVFIPITDSVAFPACP